ncbi:MAG: hypothetical protein VW440_08485, partial [Bordetella sp.]
DLFNPPPQPRGRFCLFYPDWQKDISNVFHADQIDGHVANDRVGIVPEGIRPLFGVFVVSPLRSVIRDVFFGQHPEGRLFRPFCRLFLIKGWSPRRQP